MPSDFPIVAKTLSGLEDVLARELVELGAGKAKAGRRAVKLRGDLRTLYRINLHCRTATRILMPIKEFRVANEYQLYKQVGEIDWSQYLNPRGSLAVDVFLAGAVMTHSRYVAQKTKDAIVDQFREKLGCRPSVDRDNPDLRLNLHLAGKFATLSLDSSGSPLSKRGYRTSGGVAPLSEVLAAGILRLTGWTPGETLVDGMCGSGTFPIEAALMATNRAPGLLRREFGFQRWTNFDPSLWTELLDEAREQVQAEPAASIVGSDLDGALVDEAVENARRAGVSDLISFQKGGFEQLTPPDGPGTLVMNPPYGERLTIDDIGALYHRMGDAMKQHFAGYTAWILTASDKAAKQIGLRATRRIRLFNPPLECRLLRFELYQGTRKGKAQE